MQGGLPAQHDSGGNVQRGGDAAGLFQCGFRFAGEDFADLGLIHVQQGGEAVLRQSHLVHSQFEDFDEGWLLDGIMYIFVLCDEV